MEFIRTALDNHLHDHIQYEVIDTGNDVKIILKWEMFGGWISSEQIFSYQEVGTYDEDTVGFLISKSVFLAQVKAKRGWLKSEELPNIIYNRCDDCGKTIKTPSLCSECNNDVIYQELGY